MNKHNKITALERDQIAWWLACGITIREMARRLGRNPSSISEELKRNKADGVYGSIKAHQAAEARKRNSHQKYLCATPCKVLSYQTPFTKGVRIDS
jgi:IS30 family transposase